MTVSIFGDDVLNTMSWQFYLFSKVKILGDKKRKTEQAMFFSSSSATEEV